MTDGKQEGAPQEGEGEDALWRLLERAPRPRPVSPYFARRVLREVAALEDARPPGGTASNWLARLWPAWRWTPGAAFASALAVMTLLAAGGIGLSSVHRPAPVSPMAVNQPERETPGTTSGEDPALSDPVVLAAPNPSPSVAVPPEPVVTAQDVEVIADLDNLLSREESRLWTEDDNTTARF